MPHGEKRHTVDAHEGISLIALLATRDKTYLALQDGFLESLEGVKRSFHHKI